jgi:predicted transcriptional regulator
MKSEETISWIFLATALASQNEPTNLDGISMIADGINHAVPTKKELTYSLTWLSDQNLVVKSENKYELSNNGKKMFTKLSGKDDSLMIIWNRIEKEIKNVCQQ